MTRLAVVAQSIYCSMNRTSFVWFIYMRACSAADVLSKTTNDGPSVEWRSQRLGQ